jgi:hypothetical protein
VTNLPPRYKLDELIETQRLESERKFRAALESQWEQFGEIREKNLLVSLGFASEEFYENCVASHPAKGLEQDLANVDRAFDILSKSHTAIIDLAGQLQARVSFGLHDDNDHVEILSKATGEIYTYACATASLVQAYRHLISGRPAIADKYKSLQAELLPKSGIIKFFADLRVASNHLHILIASPHFTITDDFRRGKREVVSGIAFNQAKVLGSKDWSEESKRYVSQLGDRLDAVRLVQEHFSIASELKRVLLTRTGIRADVGFRDLRRISIARKTMSYRNSLAILLQIAIPKRLNPYEYLERWFTESELERTYAFEDHSREQVDYLISLRDPLGLCPQDTRNDLYKLFGVQSSC